jgi:hypothetical protein
MFALGALLFCSCARVPVEVRTAMEKQSAELRLIRENHHQSMEVLFEQIRALQHSTLDDLEQDYQAKYARGPKAVKVDDSTPAVIYTDKDGKGLPPSFNPDRDVIAVSTARIISEWFRNKRTDSDQKLQAVKAEFMKLDGHLQIAQTINESVSDYVDSLVNMKTKQKEVGQTLLKKVSAIPGLRGIERSALSLFKIDTKELDAQLTKPGNTKAGGGS